MALTVQDKKVFRQMFPKRSYSTEMLTIIDSGTAGAISVGAERLVGVAIPNRVAAANVVAAIEGGTALSEKAARMIRRAAGSKLHGTNIVTEINALS